jgi:hypothetical protein
MFNLKVLEQFLWRLSNSKINPQKREDEGILKEIII